MTAGRPLGRGGHRIAGRTRLWIPKQICIKQCVLLRFSRFQIEYPVPELDRFLFTVAETARAIRERSAQGPLQIDMVDVAPTVQAVERLQAEVVRIAEDIDLVDTIDDDAVATLRRRFLAHLAKLGAIGPDLPFPRGDLETVVAFNHFAEEMADGAAAYVETGGAQPWP